MPHARPRGKHLARRLRSTRAVAAEEPGDRLLLCVTRGGHVCRSGSEVSQPGVPERARAPRWGEGLAGCRVPNASGVEQRGLSAKPTPLGAVARLGARLRTLAPAGATPLLA